MAYTLPELGYAYDALEPHFDAMTMEIHHSKHHQTYVNNANAIVETLPEAYQSLSAEALIARIAELPADKQTPVRNNVGGHANHTLFWQILKTGTTLSGSLKDAIERDFGSVEAFQAEFEKAAQTRFGSGWAWLVVENGFHCQPRQPADGRSHRRLQRHALAHAGRLGTRVLLEIPKPPPRLHQSLLARCQLGRGATPL